MAEQPPPRDCGALKGYLETSVKFYEDLLGYKPEKTKLNLLNSKDWKEFSHKFNSPKKMNGIYIPRSETAITRVDIPSPELSLFHEYFGHGLFSERTQLGEKLVNLEKKLMKEEINHFKNRKITHKEIERFRNKNQICNELMNLKEKVENYYENWAIFTEYLLGRECKLNGEFEKKYENLSDFGKKELEKFVSFDKEFGSLAIHYANGFEKYYSQKKLKTLLKNLYKGDLDNIRLSVVYGSQKPHSDIDLFNISENLEIIDEDRIDSRVITPVEFEKRAELFDICITDPIFSGTYLMGNEKYFNKIKKQLKSQPITEKSIQHNLNYSEFQKKLANSFPTNSYENKKHLGYAKTLLLNAISLKKGRRILTKKGLEGSHSQGENFIELQGGIN